MTAGLLQEAARSGAIWNRPQSASSAVFPKTSSDFTDRRFLALAHPCRRLPLLF
jgi:hypothetical protein